MWKAGGRMTNEEAIDGLKRIFNEHELDLQICGIKQDSLVIRDMAISALDKQIPKKPVGRHKKCPTCEMIEFGYDEVNYCEWCGQKLDFGRRWKNDE